MQPIVSSLLYASQSRMIWIVRHAGSERVVEEILRAFPDSDVLTSIVDRHAVSGPLAACTPVVSPGGARGCRAPRVVSPSNAARLAIAETRRRSRRRHLEQPRLRKGREDGTGDPTPLLLPHADAVRVGLRRRGCAFPRRPPRRCASLDAALPPLGPRDGPPRYLLPGELKRRRRANCSLLRPLRPGRPSARGHGLLHSRAMSAAMRSSTSAGS